MLFVVSFTRKIIMRFINSMYQCFSFLLSSIPACLSVSVLIDIYVSSLESSEVKAVVNIQEQVVAWTHAFILSGEIPRGGMA